MSLKKSNKTKILTLTERLIQRVLNSENISKHDSMINELIRLIEKSKGKKPKSKDYIGFCGRCLEHAVFNEVLGADKEGQETFDVLSNCCGAPEYNVNEDDYRLER